MNPREYVENGKYGKGHTASPELIDAIRRCAAAKMSLGATADELTTRTHPLTRSAVAGIAKRNGISFAKALKPKPEPRKPKDRRTIPAKLETVLAKMLKPKPPDKPRPNFVTERVRSYVRPPRANCSWAGCASHAEEGGMFCYSHGRKGLMA